jgi:hypothetical protein
MGLDRLVWGLNTVKLKRFVSSQIIQTYCRENPAFSLMDMGACCWGLKQPGHEADSSPPSNAEIKNK